MVGVRGWERSQNSCKQKDQFAYKYIDSKDINSQMDKRAFMKNMLKDLVDFNKKSE